MGRKRRNKANAKSPGKSTRHGSSTNTAGPSLSSVRLLSVLLVVLVVVIAVQWWWYGDRSVAERPRPVQEVTAASLARHEHASSPRFTPLSPQQTGVDFTNKIDTSHPMKYVYFSGTAGGGVAIGDVDADGLPDLYLVNGPGKNRLYRNEGGFKFADMTETAGVDGGDAWGTGASMADVNNDGWLDIYVCNYDSENLLYINQGDGSFQEMGELLGVSLVDASMMGSFADYDRDGDLDLYVLTYRYFSPNGRPKEPPIEVVNGERRIKKPYNKYYRITDDAWSYGPVARNDWLFRNDGDQFTPVSLESGITGKGHGLSATWWDFNQDGWPDLYVANDFMDPDQLLLNQGDGTFKDIIADTVPHTSWYSMGADIGDVNNDGLIDLLVADMAGRTHFKQKTSMGSMSESREFLETAVPRQYMRNALLINTGTHRMMEAAYLAGLAQTNWTWTVKLADLDNDGHVDAYFTNGSPRNFIDSDIPFHADMLIGRTNWDLYEDAPPLKEQNLAFRNQGEFTFEEVSGAWGLDHEGISLAAAHADLDRDGDLDMVVANFDEPVSIYRNDASGGNGLLVQLEGGASNRYGVGATVTLQTERGKQVRFLNPYTGFLASNEPVVHFGVGQSQRIESLTVDWPSGHRQVLADVVAGKLYTIAEPDKPPPALSPARSHGDQPSSEDEAQPLFASSDHFKDVRHREQPFDDYRLQPLLPNKLSQLGPGMAWGDADGDGDDDLFVGGAAGDPGKLLINESNGHFARNARKAFEADRFCEDMGAVWLDFDGDGDLDLYVASGSVEVAADDETLQDRLYINDGTGELERANADVLPQRHTSSGAVAAADFDRDSDVDLFVGGRALPGQYPLAPNSYLLRNDDGEFTDATDDVAAAVRASGMVTSGLWSDVDQDGWVDLMVTYEWGPVRYFRNQAGRLFDRTKEANLDEYTGWFNGIAGGDVDNDGDIDYVVTNFGLNNKYHASARHPALLYYGDFDNTGRMRLIEAEYEDTTLFPVRGKSCSTNAMPHLADKFQSYRQFAVASLQEIYTPTCLAESHRFAATTLESAVLLNDGSGKFTFASLPRLAQVAPAFGTSLLDCNGDGNLDVVVVQNFYNPQPETGRMAGGLSLLLRGHGDGTFDAAWPTESGIVVPGDAKSLTVSDINGDQLPDLVVGMNDAPIEAFVQRSSTKASPLVVRLDGGKGNPNGEGARVVTKFSDGSTRTAEIYAGGGYLSQSAPIMFFTSTDGQIESIDVYWPDGSASTFENEAWRGSIVLKK